MSPRFDVPTQKSRRKAFRVWISRPTVPPNLPIGIDTETRLPLRQSEGFVGSLLSMLGLGHLGTKGKNSLWVDDGLGMRRAGVGKPLSALSALSARKSSGRQRRQGRRLLPSDEVVRATRAYRLGVLPIRPGVRVLADPFTHSLRRRKSSLRGPLGGFLRRRQLIWEIPLSITRLS